MLNHISPGRLILFNFMWNNAPLDRDFYAVTGVELLVLPRSNMVQLLTQHDEFKMVVIDSLTENINDLNRIMFTHKAASREATVARFLLDCEIITCRSESSAAIPFTMQFMAGCLRLSRPFIAKTLKYFAERLFITMHYGTITILDSQGLRRIADE
ncbi:TPA: Crp/Fnr family transcriptional regulator [Klebsiella michiganensis]|nr:Crp/Fnr family transcriptional regulator [Klebsiella michiganensis]